MHYIVKEFIGTDRTYAEIISQGGNLNEPAEVALPLLSKLTHRGAVITAETNQIIEDALVKGHPDGEVYLMFLSQLIAFYSMHAMKEKSEGAFRISCSLEIKKYHAEIQAVYYQVISLYYHLNQNQIKRDEYLLLSMKIMPKHYPRYDKFLSNFGQIFGLEGRLKVFSQEDWQLLEKASEKNFVALGSFLINAFFIVDFELIEKYYSKMILKFKENFDYQRKEDYQYAISFLKGDFQEHQIFDLSTNAIITYYKALKDKDLNRAIKLYGSIHEKGFVYNCMGVFYFLNYHHAFVIGRYEIIEDLIRSQEKLNNHYMLDFFLVRYFLIKNKKDLARFYYAQLLKNVEKFQAIGRLKYEMQFAFELTGLSFFELIQPIQAPLPVDIRKSIEIDLESSSINSNGLNRMIGKSSMILDIKEKIKKYADIDRPILIIGETGAGKELVARAIHEESVHKNKPYLAINCGALTDTLLQSELFGYEAGAFTGAVTPHKGIFEAAEEGVVFLDEFGEMSPKLQVSLLRVFENNEVMRVGGTKVKKIKCRIVAATNANIEDLISKKLFRDDLFQRLKQFTISIPPLRERKEDIPELINYFFNQQNNNQKQELSKELMHAFQEYHWPGNIRELKNEIDRIKILCGYKPIIEKQDIELDWFKIEGNVNAKLVLPINASVESNAEQMHQRILEKKLSKSDKRLQQIKSLFQQYKQLTRGQIAAALQISLITASKDLDSLCAENFIVKRMPSKCLRSYYYEIISTTKKEPTKDM